MRHFRNPKFAMEALEKKLNPSGIIPVAAEVHVLAAHVNVATSSTAIDNNHSSNTVTAAERSGSTFSHGAHSLTPDSYGTDPEPPDGDGTVPTGPPTLPDGPDSPA